MKVSIKDSAPCEKTLSVAVQGDLIAREYDQFFQAIGKEAKVPGFRPGKAPREVLARHYATEAREKVLERLISHSLHEAVEEKQLRFLGHPTVRGVEFTDEKLTYEALLEMPPAIRLGKYRGLSAVKPAVEVKPEEVETALRHLQESHAKFQAVENRPSQMGDSLIADYRCLVEGKEVEKRDGDWIELREEEFLKGFSPQLVGLCPGKEKEVRLPLPEKFGRKEWAGKVGVFEVKVREIKTKTLPPLDDELAKETGEFQTLEELKTRLRQRIEEDQSRRAEVEYEKGLLDALLKENVFEVPKGVVERRLRAILEEAVQSLYRSGIPEEALEKQAESLKEKLRPEAENQVRLAFLLEEIAKKEKLEFKEEDFQIKYQSLASRHRQTEAAVKKYYEEHSEAKESLGIQILNEKAIQLIKDNAKTGRVS